MRWNVFDFQLFGIYRKWNFHFFLRLFPQFCFVLHVITHFSGSREIQVFEKKVQVGKDQEKAQSKKDSHSKNRGGKKTN